MPLESTRVDKQITGVIMLKTGLVLQSMPNVVGAYRMISERVRGAAPTLTTAPPVSLAQSSSDSQVLNDV